MPGELRRKPHRVTQAYGADVGVGRCAVLVLASAECLGPSTELDVALNAYHCFIGSLRPDLMSHSNPGNFLEILLQI